jgi:hypothetical protein
MKHKINDTPKDQRVDTDERNQQVVQYFSYILIAFCIILLILLIWMRNRVRLAIGIIKEASKAITAMPLIILFPAAIFCCVACFTIYWLVVALYAHLYCFDLILCSFLSSAGHSQFVGDQFKGYNPDKVVRGLQLYHFFGYLWVIQFINAIEQTTIAGAVAAWYWTLDRKASKT